MCYQKMVTIIVPCYNIEPYIGYCLHSIMSQNIINRCQVLCIDDGCTDGTTKHLEKYAKRYPRVVSVLSRQKHLDVDNFGVSSARNFGLDNVVGETVMFVDGDDLIGGRRDFPGKCDKYCLENFYDTMKSHPDTAMVVGNIEYITRDSSKIISTRRFDILNDRLTHDISKHDQALDFLDMRISSCATLYRTSVINNHNVRFRPRLRYFEDAQFAVQYAFAAVQDEYPYILRPTDAPALYLYRSRPHSAMHKLSRHSEGDMRRLDRTKSRMEYYAYFLEQSEKQFGTASRIYNIAAHRYANKTAKDIEENSKSTKYTAEYNALLDYLPYECRHDCNNNDCSCCPYHFKLEYKRRMIAEQRTR